MYHMYTMRNHCPLMLSLTLTPSRLSLILLDPKSFQTVLASVTWLPGHMLSIHCRLIRILSIYVWLTLTLAKVCLHSCLITLSAMTSIFLFFTNKGYHSNISVYSKHNITFFQVYDFAININDLQSTLESEIFVAQQYYLLALDFCIG